MTFCTTQPDTGHRVVNRPSEHRVKTDPRLHKQLDKILAQKTKIVLCAISK